MSRFVLAKEEREPSMLSTSLSSSLLLALSPAAAAAAAAAATTTTTPPLLQEFTPKDDVVISSPTNYPASIVAVETSAMSSISGVAFFDSKGDGNYDAITSAGISNTFVSLFTCSNNIINKTKTDTMGYYSFEKLYKGRYYINATAPQWYAFSDMWSGKTDGITTELLNPETDSAVNPDTGRTECFDLTEGESETVSFGFALKLDVPPNPVPTTSVSGSDPAAMVAMRYPSASPSKYAKFSSLEPSVSKSSSSQLSSDSNILPSQSNITIVKASSPPSIIFHKPSQNPTPSSRPTIMPSALPDSDFIALLGGVHLSPDGLPEESGNPKENGNATSYFAIITAVCIGTVLVAVLVLIALRRRKHRRKESIETHGSNTPSCSEGLIEGDLETGLQTSYASRQTSFTPPPKCKPSLMHLDAKYCNSRINIYSVADVPKVTSFKILKINVIAPVGKLQFVTEKPPSGGPSYICYIRDTCPIIDQIHLDDEIVALDEQDVRNMAVEKLSELLASKSEQVERKLTLLREIRPDGDGAAAVSRRSPSRRLSINSIADIPELTSLSIIKVHLIAPAGKLGIIIKTSYNDGPAYVCEVKNFSPVAGQIHLEDGIIAIDDEDVRHLPGISLRKLLADKIDQAERKITVLRRVVDRCKHPAGVEGEDPGCTSPLSVPLPLSLQGTNTNGAEDTSPQLVAAPVVGPGGKIEDDVSYSDISHDGRESGTTAPPTATKRSEGESHLMQAPSSENASPQLVAAPEIGLRDKVEEDIMFQASSDLGGSDVSDDEREPRTAALPMATNRAEGEPHLMQAHNTMVSHDGRTQLQVIAYEKSLSNVIDAAGRGQNRNKMSSYSLAQLRFSNMQLHGREEALNVLTSITRELKQNAGSVDTRAVTGLPEIVLVSGASGTGKSALVARGLRDPATKIGMAFAGGKFDLNNTALPLSAFVDAMASLTAHVMARENAEDIMENVLRSFGEEDMLLLARALPGCEYLFGSTVQDILNRQTGEANHYGKEAVARLQYLIGGLLKVICTSLNGVVLFIDDLQWSDAATLDLIKSISLDVEIPSLLLAGAYREDEVSESHPLKLFIREKQQALIKVREIEIDNLSPNNVKSLVAEALGMEDNEGAVETLAMTVHKKTQGNAFFVLTFLRSLHEEEILQYSFGLMKWVWDDDAIKRKLATENVATILISKLKRFNESSQIIIKIAACLGAKFRMSNVATVTKYLSQTESKRLLSTADTDSVYDLDAISTFDICICEFENEGLWEKEKGDVWHFGHDQIQSAAFQLIPAKERDGFRGHVGTIMMKQLDPNALEASLFEAVSLCNCAMAELRTFDERRELARMNLRAGTKAAENAAFDTAAVYFKAGHGLMGSEGWDTDQDMMLKLCSEGANVCFVCGDIDQMNQLIEEVISKGILSIGDKFRAYEVKILATQAAGKYQESISLAIEVRRQLGLPSPANKSASILTILKDQFKTKRALGGMTPEDIANLPMLMDERIIKGQRMLELMITSCYQALPTMFPLVVLLLLRTSLKHGINASSIDGFATYGVLLCGPFGDPQRGHEMADTVNLIMLKPGMERMKSRAIFISQAMIIPWTATPLRGTLAPLLEGCQIGLATGDTESASFCIMHRAFHLTMMGRPLGSVEQELQAACDLLVKLNQVDITHCILAHLLIVKILRGTKTGDEEDFDNLEKCGAANSAQVACIIAARLELHVILSNWEAAKKLSLRTEDLRRLVPGKWCGAKFTLHEALVFLKQAQDEKTSWKRRKWKRRAQKPIRILRGWAKKGNINVVHYLHLVCAECAALEGKVEEAEENYKAAIRVATRNGFVQDRALSHELASKYFACKGDHYWKDYHLKRAVESYTAWGATLKAEQLKKK